MNRHFIKVQNCFTVRGYNRSSLLDVQRRTLYYIPHDLEDILDYKYGNTIESVKLNCNFDKEIIDEYFDYLTQMEFIYFLPEAITNQFPKVQIQYKEPSISESVIINYKGVFLNQDHFDFLNAKYLEIRTEFEFINRLYFDLKSTLKSTIHSIIIYIIGKGELTEDLRDLVLQIAENPRVIQITIENNEKLNFDNNCIVTTKKIEFDTDFLTIETNIIINIRFFMESNFYNPYFNSKLYVDSNGNLYNTPKKNLYFGKIEEIYNLKSQNWDNYLNKPLSEVEECSYCEHRFCCLNSLDREININNRLYNKHECNYNPFISKWLGEPGYLSLSECGIESKHTGFLIDIDKLKRINEELWCES